MQYKGTDIKYEISLIVLEELCVNLWWELVFSILVFYLLPAGASQHRPVPRSYLHNTYKIQCHFSWGCWSVVFHRESQTRGPLECRLVARDLLGLIPDKTKTLLPLDKRRPDMSASHCPFLFPLYRLSSSWYQRDKTILSPVCLYKKRKRCELISAQTRLKTQCMDARKNSLRIFIPTFYGNFRRLLKNLRTELWQLRRFFY